MAPATDVTAVLATRPVRIADVVGAFERLERALPPADGVGAFTHLYLEVTREVERALRPGTFEDARFIRWLDVVFADLFLEAMRAAFLLRGSTPRAWAPLVEGRGRPGIARIQFALAGMNAHINRDLPVALVETWRTLGLEPDRDGPQYRDYTRVNELLEIAEGRVKAQFATGPLGALDRTLGPADDRLAMWKVARAREAAWTSAETLWALRGQPRAAAGLLRSLDRLVGLASRGLLVPCA